MADIKNSLLLFICLLFISSCAFFKPEPVVIKVITIPIPHSPKEAKRHHEIGRTFVKSGEYGKAIVHFKKATKLNKKIVVYQYDLAVAYTSVKPTSQAATRAFKQAISLSSKNNGKKDKEVYYSYYGLASIYALRGNKSIAVDYLVKAVRAGFSHYNMLINDGDFRSLKGYKRFDDFIKSLS